MEKIDVFPQNKLLPIKTQMGYNPKESHSQKFMGNKSHEWSNVLLIYILERYRYSDMTEQ